MFTVFNIGMLLLAGLIAYWWANQGLFSALLHLICVIVAGALAFAFWEPLTFLIMRGSGWDGYAWGISLVATFAILLFLFRIAMDKLAPNNVNLPHWANLVFGGIFGAGSGVLTVGILIIGLGHVQSRADVMGFKGYQRDRDKKARVSQVNGLWVPFHTLTGQFYSTLSVGSFSSGSPLKHYAPSVDHSATLARDSFDNGKGRTTMLPTGVKIRRVESDAANPRRIFVTVDFDRTALDFGEQLTLTSSQIRLVQDVRGSTTPDVLYPLNWYQPHSGLHKFDHRSHVMTSETGQDDVKGVIFEFEAPDSSFVPRFILFKSTRFSLPEFEDASNQTLARTTDRADEIVVAAGVVIQNAIKVDNGLRPYNINADKNNLPAGVSLDEELYITSCNAVFKKGEMRPSRKLLVKGFYEPDGARCVTLDISRASDANLWGLAESQGITGDARIKMVDDNGNSYTAVGYVLVENQTDSRVKLDPVSRIPRLEDVPALPTSGNQKLVLLFYVTTGETITGVTVGDINLGSCNIQVRSKRI